MKILLIGFAKIKYMPYANFYLESIDRSKHEVHLLYWNRDLKEEDLSRYEGITLHEFKLYQEDNVSQLSKIGSFIKYRRFAKKILKQNKFDFAVLLHSFPGVLLNRVWTRRFKNRYIFDYRDSTYERYSFFKRIIGRLVSCSRGTFTSSDGFRKFFPENEQDKVYTAHNILTDSLLYRRYEKNESDRIRVAFWGFIRDEAINREMIRKIAADKRFELHYYGREQRVAYDLKAYAAELGADNVYFHGEYLPSDRYEFAKNTDIIHNVYSAPNMMLAMGNKYYDGAIFYIPQICMQGSFMGKTAENCGIGYVCDPRTEDFTDGLYEYYIQTDKKQFEADCDAELDRVMKQYNDGVEFLKRSFCDDKD